MLSSDCSEISIIKNHVTVESDNTLTYESTSSPVVIYPNTACLVLAQYATIVRNRLIYYIYVINNVECNIENIKLKDILPDGVELISTSVENGKYKYYDSEIFYNIDCIKAHSFSKITIVLRPITLGEKTNSIEVLFRNLKDVINNPSKLSCILCLKLECNN